MFFELLCKSQQVRLRRRCAGGGLGLQDAYVVVERARTVRKLRRLLDDAGQQGQLVRAQIARERRDLHRARAAVGEQDGVNVPQLRRGKLRRVRHVRPAPEQAGVEIQ